MCNKKFYLIDWRYTNIIIIDQDEIVLEALRHINHSISSRVVEVGSKLLPLEQKNFTKQFTKLENPQKKL